MGGGIQGENEFKGGWHGGGDEGINTPGSAAQASAGGVRYQLVDTARQSVRAAGEQALDGAPGLKDGLRKARREGHQKWSGPSGQSPIRTQEGSTLKIVTRQPPPPPSPSP